ncbi:MAG: enoyl-CoA hydratase, partial [Acidobacteria bacterium]
MNALTFDVYRELTDTFRALSDRADVRAVVLTGTGRAFCTGGDVREIIGALLGRDEKARLEFTTLTCDLIRAMRALPRPIVASLNGTVAGAGAAIALASDLRVAADTARIAFLFVKVGLSGADMGAAHLLPRMVGLGRATELLMTGDFIEADEALRIGLYNR